MHLFSFLKGSSDGANYGTLDFWVRLRVPMDQAIRLYKVSDAKHSKWLFHYGIVQKLVVIFCRQERTKALGYLSANSAATQKQLDTSLTLQRQDENFNQLEVRIMSCNHVQARRPGSYAPMLKYAMRAYYILIPECFKNFDSCLHCTDQDQMEAISLKHSS